MMSFKRQNKKTPRTKGEEKEKKKKRKAPLEETKQKEQRGFFINSEQSQRIIIIIGPDELHTPCLYELVCETFKGLYGALKKPNISIYIHFIHSCKHSILFSLLISPPIPQMANVMPFLLESSLPIVYPLALLSLSLHE